MRNWFRLTTIAVLVLCTLAGGQTFEVNQPGGAVPDNKKKDTSAQSNSSGQNLGWGSSIEVARQARAAQDALKKGDYAAAFNYAQQAAKAAPQNAAFWFLAGYAARLAGHYQESVDAYTRGLQNQPTSISGLSGLAQTYAKMGRDDEARKLLQRVVAANPKDPNTLQLAGELTLESDPRRAVELFRRVEGIQPSARNDLLIARGYQRLNQPEQAGEFLSRAKNKAPRDPEILRAVAGQYRDAGQYDRAIAALKAIPSNSPDTLAELAYTYELAGEKQQAADLYTKAAHQNRGNLSFELSAAQALVNLGEIESAKPFLADARQLNSNHYRLHAIQAQIAAADERIPEAIQEYHAAINNLPGSASEGPLYPIQLRLNLYELYQQQGDVEGGKQQLASATSELAEVKVPEQARPEFLRLRAAVEASSGDLDTANKDLNEALSLAPHNVNAMLNYASVLWKLGQKDAARKLFGKALDIDRRNRLALVSLGALARDQGDPKTAETYFSRAAEFYPKDFGPQLALGDLHTSQRSFRAAQANYEAAYQRNPQNAQVIAGGAAAALEGHDLDLAERWLDRAKGPTAENPQVMRERQRYLTWKGNYQEAEQLGSQVIERMPRDPQVPVYLAYDLYYLGRYQEALDLATRYETILPKNKDLALIAGYVHARGGQFPEALADFTRALERDPNMATGYANRGFIHNDLRQPGQAVEDFRRAIQLRSDYPEAHLGLAYAYLQVHRAGPAQEELDKSRKPLGATRPWHLARAEAFRQQRNLNEAIQEYRVALSEVPTDLTTQLALAESLYRLHRYDETLSTLNVAMKLSPNNPNIYVQSAQAHARLDQRNEAINDIKSAETYGKGDAGILMGTGDALLTLGERDEAMRRFSLALDAPNTDRMAIRLAIAEVFVRRGQYDDARRQIALGLSEARTGEGQPITAEDLAGAANILLAAHDLDLAATYFEKARQAGADPRTVGLGLANTYLAAGENRKAEVELAELGKSGSYKDDYDYMIAKANLYRQRQDTLHALSAFSRASALEQDDADIADTAQYELAGAEGLQINQHLSLASSASLAPALEDINVYTLDAKLLAPDGKLLPPPRHSYQSIVQEHYTVHVGSFPTITGFAGETFTTGRFSFPSEAIIQNRNTYDTIFNGGISPVLRLGSDTITFNTGLQFTVRRDTASPTELNQNLFRQFLYVSTSSFFNWVSIRGSAIREAGPFTEQGLHSRDAAANIEFTVGRPWGHTALIAGYYARDLLFRPLIREYFTTSTYGGVQHQFGRRLTVGVLGEYLRSWRVLDNQFVIAQALVPGARFDYRATSRWKVEGSFTLSRGEGFHTYDNAQSQFLISYVKPIRRSYADDDGNASVNYPARFSFGVQQQTFYNFTGSGHTVVLPVVQFRLF